MLRLLLFLPAIKIFAIALMYKLTAALAEPLGEQMASDLLSEVGDALFLMLAAVILVGLLFFAALIIVVAVANFTLFMR